MAAVGRNVMGLECQELHRLCPLFADRTQEDGKQTGRGQAHIPASHALTGQLLRLQWLMARPQPP
jgi:hypothetical protein